MSRLASMPTREEIGEHERAAYDRVVDRQAKLWESSQLDSNGYFGALLNSPPMADEMVNVGRLMREGEARGGYSNRQRELVDVVFSVDFGYNTILELHIPDALSVGVRLEAIDAIRAGDDQALTDEERQIADYARRVAAGSVEDASYAEMERLLGPRGAVEFTVFIGLLLCTMRLWQALGVPDVPEDRIDEMLQGYRQGTAALVDPSARIG